jgi:hypothetical protein
MLSFDSVVLVWGVWGWDGARQGGGVNAVEVNAVEKMFICKVSST